MSGASENRRPKVGDLVDVGFAGKIYHTKITRIQGVGLYLTDLNSEAKTVIYWRDGWHLANGEKADSVRFQKDVPDVPVTATATEGLTGSQLADLEILTLADSDTFYNLCATNRKLHMLCTNPKYQNQLYSERVLLHMPKFARLVDSKNSWKRVHDKVLEIQKERSSRTHLQLVNLLVKNNDLLGLKILDLKDRPASVTNVLFRENVYRGGSLDILKWILDQGYSITPYSLAYTAATGKVDIIDFVNKIANSNTTSLGEPETEKEPNVSAYLEEIEKRTGSLLADDIREARDAFLDSKVITNAASYGQIEVLDWYQKNYPGLVLGADISNNVGLSIKGQHEKQVAILEWMKANQIPIYNSKNGGAGQVAAESNNVLALNWLEKEGLFNIENKKGLIQHIADIAAYYVNFDAFEWAYDRGAKILREHIGGPLMRRNIPMLEFFYSKGVYPDEDSVKNVRRQGFRDNVDEKVDPLIAWFNEKGLYTK